jgi:hypothetical protein
MATCESLINAKSVFFMVSKLMKEREFNACSTLSALSTVACLGLLMADLYPFLNMNNRIVSTTSSLDSIPDPLPLWLIFTLAEGITTSKGLGVSIPSDTGGDEIVTDTGAGSEVFDADRCCLPFNESRLPAGSEMDTGTTGTGTGSTGEGALGDLAAGGGDDLTTAATDFGLSFIGDDVALFTALFNVSTRPKDEEPSAVLL